MPPRDWIDDMADEALETDDGWRPLAEPMTRPVLDLAERCSSFEEFEDGLAELIPAAQDVRRPRSGSAAIAAPIASDGERRTGRAAEPNVMDTRNMALALGRALFVARAAAETRDQDA